MVNPTGESNEGDRPRIEKPPKGDDCNGCGFCCLAEQCCISVELFGEAAVCPALEAGESRYWCGLMRNPAKYNAVPPEFEDLKEVELSKGASQMSLEFLPEYAAKGYYRMIIGEGMGCDSTDKLIDLV